MSVENPEVAQSNDNVSNRNIINNWNKTISRIYFIGNVMLNSVLYIKVKNGDRD